MKTFVGIHHSVRPSQAQKREEAERIKAECEWWQMLTAAELRADSDESYEDWQMKTNVKPTSRKAHKINIAGRLYAPCYVAIVKALRKAKKPLSRTEIELITGLRINQVTGRVNDLLAANIAKVEGRKICSVTKREVEGVMLA